VIGKRASAKRFGCSAVKAAVFLALFLAPVQHAFSFAVKSAPLRIHALALPAPVSVVLHLHKQSDFAVVLTPVLSAEALSAIPSLSVPGEASVAAQEAEASPLAPVRAAPVARGADVRGALISAGRRIGRASDRKTQLRPAFFSKFFDAMGTKRENSDPVVASGSGEAARRTFAPTHLSRAPRRAESAPLAEPALRLEPSAPERRSKTREVFERAKLLFLRALTLPAHVWPFNKLARALSHGEPLTGLTPESAVNVAVENSRLGVATVIGRLAPGLRDRWSTRGAEKSFKRLIALSEKAKAEHPGMDISVALDAAYFGSELAGAGHAQRARAAAEAMLRLAKEAHARGVGVEMDVTESKDIPLNYLIAERIVREAKVPVRLAIAARHKASGDVLKSWISLAEETGVRSGVRLVKGSYVETTEESVNLRRPLLENYEALISIALEGSGYIDVGVATHNLRIFKHAEGRAAETNGRYGIHVIKGVNPGVQAIMRKAGKIMREYVSYGMDAPIFGLMEMYSNWRARREWIRRGHRREDLDYDVHPAFPYCYK
jgi:hypothetical protein